VWGTFSQDKAGSLQCCGEGSGLLLLLHAPGTVRRLYPYLLASTEVRATAAYCQTFRDALPGGGTGPSLSVKAAAALFHLLAMAPGRHPPAEDL
jgi:hypothetical protein